MISSRRVILIGRRRRIRGRGCRSSTARHRRHTGADCDTGGNTTPVGPIIAATADVNITVYINVTTHVAVRREVTVGRYVALEIAAIETASVDCGTVELSAAGPSAPAGSGSAARPGAAAATTLHQHQR